MFLIIFGWICLLLITCYFTFATIAGFYVSVGFTGKVEPFLFVYVLISAGLIWLMVHVAPFTTNVNLG